jgi:hypothetical protein
MGQLKVRNPASDEDVFYAVSEENGNGIAPFCGRPSGFSRPLAAFLFLPAVSGLASAADIVYPDGAVTFQSPLDVFGPNAPNMQDSLFSKTSASDDSVVVQNGVSGHVYGGMTTIDGVAFDWNTVMIQGGTIGSTMFSGGYNLYGGRGQSSISVAGSTVSGNGSGVTTSTGKATLRFDTDMTLDQPRMIVIDTADNTGAFNTDENTVGLSGIDARNGNPARTDADTLMVTGDSTAIQNRIVRVQDGTLQLGDGGASESIATPVGSSIDTDAALAYSHSNGLTETQRIIGGGALILRGSGTLTVLDQRMTAGNRKSTGQTSPVYGRISMQQLMFGLACMVIRYATPRRCESQNPVRDTDRQPGISVNRYQVHEWNSPEPTGDRHLEQLDRRGLLESWARRKLEAGWSGEQTPVYESRREVLWPGDHSTG